MILNELRYILRSHLQNSEFRNRAWFAGGSVRDYLLSPASELSGDIDITVEAEQGGIRLAAFLADKMQLEPGQSYPEYGTASLRTDGLILEFVATRKEKYIRGSRYPKVSFGNIQDDVLRRDFTINSLLLPIHEGEIADLSGQGLRDLNLGIICSMGNAEHKFREDPLRMLRAIRFSLRFGFEIEPHTLQALRSEASHLKHLSNRQINLELSKMNFASNEAEIIRRFMDLGWTGLLERLPV